MANRYFTGGTCPLSGLTTFIADDTIILANPLNRTYQLSNGLCVVITASGATTTNSSTVGVVFGPYTSCTECITPISAGTESTLCLIDCSGVTATKTYPPHSTYVNGFGRAVSQLNSIELGGANGLNN